MDKKLGLFLLFLILISIGGLFAQNDYGYIKPTFSGGVSNFSCDDFTDSLISLALDVDFVSISGLTFGFHSLQAWSGAIAPFSFVAFGIGYSLNVNRWSTGIKVMAVPFSDGGIGFDANETLWFNEYIGLTAILNYYIGIGSKWDMYSARLGISAKI